MALSRGWRQASAPNRVCRIWVNSQEACVGFNFLSMTRLGFIRACSRSHLVLDPPETLEPFHAGTFGSQRGGQLLPDLGHVPLVTPKDYSISRLRRANFPDTLRKMSWAVRTSPRTAPARRDSQAKDKCADSDPGYLVGTRIRDASGRASQGGRGR